MSHAQDRAAEPVRAANEAKARSQFERLITNLSARAPPAASHRAHDRRQREREQILAQSLSDNRQARTVVQTRVRRVNLHLALGGSFELPPRAPSTARP